MIADSVLPLEQESFIDSDTVYLVLRHLNLKPGPYRLTFHVHDLNGTIIYWNHMNHLIDITGSALIPHAAYRFDMQIKAS